MRSTLQLLTILLTLITVSLMSCTTSGISTGISGNCENSLYPVKQGAIWIYTSNGGPNGSFTYSDTITDVHEDGFTLTSKFEDITRAQEWHCQIDGLKALQIGGGSAAGISTQGITASFMTTEVTGISLPREISTGMKWEYGLTMQGSMAMPGNLQSPASGRYNVTMQEMGTETITIAAGVFDTIRFQANSLVDITTDFQGIQLPIKYEAATLLWYAPNVGFVKSVENGDFSGTGFSITTELQSYNIPK